MEPVTSLREVFASLAGGSSDPAAALSAAGHGDLPGDLVAEAIVNYADAAPVEVAEHLSPFVVSHSAVPQSDEASADAPDTGDGLALLTDAPSGHDLPPEHEPSHDPGHDVAPDGPAVLDAGADAPADDDAHDGSALHHDPADLFFGAGEPVATEGDVPHPGAETVAADLGVDHDPAVLDQAGTDGGWLDVTAPDVDGGLSEPVDTPHHDADAAAPSPLEDHDDHDGGGVLDAGAGA